MGRIRTVKPELIHDQRLATLSDTARLMYYATLAVVDDSGRAQAAPSYLHGVAFWGQPRSMRKVADAIDELEHAKIWRIYEANGGKYLEVVGWDDRESPFHQKIDRRQPSSLPGPRSNDSSNEQRTVVDESATEDCPTTTTTETTTTTRTTIDPPNPHRGVRSRRKSDDWTENEIRVADVVLEKLSARSGVQYRGSDVHKRLIIARLRDGVSESDLRAVIGYCAVVLEWAGDPKMHRNLRPETLFGPQTIERYLDPARTWFAQLPDDRKSPRAPRVEHGADEAEQALGAWNRA